MINLLDLYEMIKPQNSPNLYTPYELVIGATNTAKNLNNGVWILNLLNSTTLTKSDTILKKVEDGYLEKQHSIIESVYQLDFYKKFNNREDTVFVVQREALKMREWLNGFEVAEYLKGLGGEILPTLGAIDFTSEMSDSKSVLGRARLDFTIISLQEVEIKVNVAEQAVIDKGVILCNDS